MLHELAILEHMFYNINRLWFRNDVGFDIGEQPVNVINELRKTQFKARMTDWELSEKLSLYEYS